jgi:raffinose/stachyose/melibiose transport system substrate-binding protein
MAPALRANDPSTYRCNVTKGNIMERGLLSLAATSVLALVCGSGTAMAQDTTLTLWHNGSCPAENCLVRSLAEGFQIANPGVVIDIIEQPNDAYFTALLAASVTGTGPDLATMWAGGFISPYKPYLENLVPYIPADQVAASIGTPYYAEAGDATSVLYAVPTENQWYTGFYNKAIFAANGITEVPRTFDELLAVCETLKAAGVLPIISGAGGSEAQFQPSFEFSYLLTALPMSDWNGLYDGSLPYANPVAIAQLERWNDLFEAGCMNEDAFNRPDVTAAFGAGEAAMYLASGSWTIPELTAALGDDLGVMLPPYAEEPNNAIVSLAGGGIVMMNYSDAKEAGGKFLAYVMGDEGQSLMAGITAPTRPGFPTTDPLINELSSLSTNPDWQNYPMFDNFTQPAVTDAFYRNVALVLVGEMSAADALAAIDAAFASLPEEEKNVNYGLRAN